jgi:hypothetical protein
MALLKSAQNFVKSKFVRVFSKEGTPMLTQEANKPQLRLQIMINELGEFQKAIKDPLIESLTAAVILFLLRPLLPSIETVVAITLIVIMVVFVATCILAIALWKKSNELLRAQSQELIKQDDTARTQTSADAK